MPFPPNNKLSLSLSALNYLEGPKLNILSLGELTNT